MDLQRVRQDIQNAREHFPTIEAIPTATGGIYIKAALQTSVGQAYVVSVTFDNYPSSMPKVTVLAPTINHGKHMYTSGHICYMHPSYWNPAKHDLKYTLAQAAVWLNKNEVYKQRGVWPGPGIDHH
jgi:ubiquitin-protein ligase